MPNNAIQLWSPDTCDCMIHLAYDDTLPPDQRVFSYVTRDEAEAIIQARRNAGEQNINRNPQPPARSCPAHLAHGFTAVLLDKVRGENQRKNMALALAQNVVNTLSFANYSWSFDSSRVLQVRFMNISVTLQKKNQIQSACDIQFGPGLIQIN